MTECRDFKGVWIPKEIWLNEELNALDKVILTEIDSLDQGERGCYASNKYIADFCQCSETKVSTAISKLVKMGFLYVRSFDGRQRELKSRLSNFERQTLKSCKAESQILKESNIDNKPLNNTERKKERKTSYDAILSSVQDDGLRDLYYEYIKMRKMIKAPMTDRALEMLIGKVNKLEPKSIVNQKKLLENAITSNWKSVYPLKEDQREAPKIFRGEQKTTDAEYEELFVKPKALPTEDEVEAFRNQIILDYPDLEEWRYDKMVESYQRGEWE